MPYNYRKLPNQDLYRVYNTDTKEIHSYGTTLENAKKQIKLLHMVDAGVPLKGRGIDTPLTVQEIKPSNLRKQIYLKQLIRGSANLPPFIKK